MKNWFTPKYLFLFMLVIVGSKLFGQLSITGTGTAFTENFNGMGSSATAALPTGFRVGTEWSAGATASSVVYGTSGTGVVASNSSGGIINWANGVTATSTDRSLGFLNTGSFASPQSIILKFTNNTGSAIASLNISFDYEKYRTGTRQFDWTFFHGSTSSPTTAATSGNQSYPADGANAVVNPPTTLSKTVSLTGLSIANGADYYLKWTFTGLAGSTNGQGIGIDNFSITATAAISSDATLSNLVLNTGTLNPTFTSATLAYTATVPNSTTSITVTPTHTEAHSTITVNGATTASGAVSAPITLAEGNNIITIVVTAEDGTTIKTYQIVVNRAAAGVGSLTISPLPSFGNVCTNTSAGPNSFTIDASGLDGNPISITALDGFKYSEAAAGPFSSTLSVSYTGTGFTAKSIYVQFLPTAIKAYDGNIVISGNNFSNYNVAATGSGVNTAATVTASAATAITATTATIGGSISGNGCSTITEYGFKYFANSSFDPLTLGTQIAATNLSGGNFSVNLTGLDPNRQYYYYAYITSGGTTTYSAAAQSFINAPLPVVMASQPDLSFTETFADIANWTNFFISGIGANHWDGLSATTATGIPNATSLTASTNSFQSGSSASPNVSGGIHRGTDTDQTPQTESIVLLTTGTTDKTTAAAVDLYLDFTGVNAGTLSFDWASMNNVSGNRNSSLLVYYSVDGINFSLLDDAGVPNFTNGILSSGSKPNIALPRLFDKSATARLRFYIYNGTGGVITPPETSVSGSRPKIRIDNINVTAVATTPCATPTAAATNLVFGTITDVSIAGSFTAPSPATDSYIVVASTNTSLTSNPIDTHVYSLGDNIGDGTVIAKGSSTSFVASGLSASTQYNFFVFPMNSICTGGPLYYTATILTGQVSTVAGLPACAAPASAPTTYTAGTIGTNTISGSFGATTADEYLVLISKSPTFTGTLNNGQLYSNGDVIGNATVVQKGSATSFTASGLTPETDYYIYIFSVNTQACVNGPAYNTTPFVPAKQTTNPLPPCSIPTAQPTQLTFNTSNTAISGAFTPATGADDYLVIMSASATLNATPVNNTNYNVGDNFGSGIVVANSASTSFITTGLISATQYYFYVFAANKNCSGGTKYAAASPLANNTTTTSILANNYYFGNLHAHSDYSDGNKDNPTYTPAQDYAYAKLSQCMDFLGISEHNHFSSANNPGNTIGNYHLGPQQADNFTAANPGFLAMYGMEWGVISGGGHVVIYGDGMDQLFGWESGSGVWGSSNNYDVFVPKSTYTGANGLFKTINDYVSNNTFGTLAHPSFTDYNNIANTAYDAIADSAITGSAIESGPATSTNQSYANPSGISASFLTYFQTLLAKGYHLGPTIDHDNHNTTFGRTTYARTAVVAPVLTKTEIIKGMRNMHFYATEDCDSKVDFTINTKIMGSTFTDRYAPNIAVTLTDATTNTSSAIIRLMYGVPGSGTFAAKIDSIIGNKLTFSDNNLANLATGYYYVDITNGSARIITSPIWYTRNDATSAVVLPITLGSFLVQKANTTVNLTWITDQEINSSHFVIERSADGNSWTEIGKQTAAGNSTSPSNYVFNDNNPLNGINYYRLKEVDIDGKFTYSATRSVLFASKFQLSVSPNPAHNFINLYVSNNTNETYHIQLTDNNGKLLQKIDSNVQHLSINTSTYAKGVYFVKYMDNNMVTTKKIIIE